jgi:catalase
MSVAGDKRLTTAFGVPVDDDLNSKTAGPRGPVLIEDFNLINKLQHFDRERIPERVVHAKGAGAHGYFEVTDDITKCCKAKLFSQVGKRTPVFIRFSTVGGEKGSADAERDPRGFALKHYTEDGIWDMVGNNTPVFFIRDPTRFPDFIHTQKRNPQTNCKDPDMFWDFLSLTPESIHQVTILFSNRGTPANYRQMNGYSSHSLRFVNAAGEAFYVKLHYKTDAGIKNFTDTEAAEVKKHDPDSATRDLFEHIASGKSATWTMYAQIIPESKAESFKWNIFDVTKVWPHGEVPLTRIGKLVLNRNPLNYFADVEQSAFSPSHMVPGIEPSLDKMLQARLFSYPDTHVHRLGVNYHRIPINCPYASGARNYQRDGFMTVDGNQGNDPNYFPNSVQGSPQPTGELQHKYKVSGASIIAAKHPQKHPNDDFIQAGNLYRDVMDDFERTCLVENIVGHLKHAKKPIQEKMVKIFSRADKDYGAHVAEGLRKASSTL